MPYNYNTNDDDDDDEEEEEEEDDDDSVTVFTDGACSNNGRRGARAGIGVFFGNNNPNNVSRRIEGRQTNQRAEIEAARVAIEKAADMGYHHVTVVTDSHFIVNAMTKWIYHWFKNNWRTYNGNRVRNRPDFRDLFDATERIYVTWEKVPAHSGVYGNDQADSLARESLNEVIAYTYTCANIDREVGLGIYFPNGEIDDWCDILQGVPNTVQRGDVVVATVALQQAINAGFSRIVVKTNSQYLIDAQKFIFRWQQNNWTGSNGPVQNRYEYEYLLRLMDNIEVNFIKNNNISEAKELARSVL